MTNTTPPRHSRSDDRWNARAYRRSKATGWQRWVAGWPRLFKIAGGFLGLTVLLAAATRLFPVIGRAALIAFVIKAAGHLSLAVFFALMGAHLIRTARPLFRNRPGAAADPESVGPIRLFNGRARSVRSLAALLMAAALFFNLWMGIRGSLQVYRDRRARPVRAAVTLTQFLNRPSRIHLGQRRAPYLLGLTDQGLPIQVEIDRILLQTLQLRYGRPTGRLPARNGRLILYYYPNTGILDALETE